MPHLSRVELNHITERPPSDRPAIPDARLEPPVPLAIAKARNFCADQPYDFIFLARSPAFTPAEADPIYDLIRERFIDEQAYP